MMWKNNITKIIFTYIVIAVSSLLTVYAQDYQASASAPSHVVVGQRFNLTYTCNEKATINLPNIQDFTLLGGPQVSSNSSIEIINGRMSRSSTYSYTYVLQAVKEGSFEIPAAVAVINGKNIRTNQVTIHVGAGNIQQNQQQTQRGQTQTPANTQLNKEDFFIKAYASTTNPYVGEQVVVNYKLYLPAQVHRYQASIKKNPSSIGFWTYDLSDPQAEPVQTNETVNGKQYTVIDLYSIAVFPQKSGRLTISPLEIQTIIQIPVQQQRSNDPWDMFFNNPFFGGGRMQNVELPISSNSVSFTVKKLPENSPKHFSGLVGDFKLTTSLSRDVLSANDATNYKVTISGKGNIQHIETPDIVFPSDFEVQDPIITDNIQKRKQGVYGSRTFEYVIIPRNQGKFTIPAVLFSYYDKAKKRFISLESDEHKLKITKGKDSQAQLYNSSNKKNVRILGNDIRFIKTNQTNFHTPPVFLKLPLYWIIFSLPLLLFILFVIFRRKQIKERQNISLQKDKKASKMARKRLQKAEKLLKTNNQEQFYIEISKALWGYVSDKFHIPLVELSLDTARTKLEERKLNPIYIDEFLSALNLCEYVRFAPGSDLTPQKMYETAFEFITKIEQELKKNHIV